MMKRLTLLVCALTSSLILSLPSFAVPVPWTVSNLDPHGQDYLVRDPSGSLLSGDYLVQLLVDRDGDGIDPVLVHTRPLRFDIGDDSVLVSAVFHAPTQGYIPRGGFAFFFTLDTDSTEAMNATYAVRVWEGPEPGMESRFATSLPFRPRATRTGIQTVVQMPRHMRGTVGNLPPVVTLQPPVDEPMAGEVFRIALFIEEDRPPLDVRVGDVNGEPLPGTWDIYQSADYSRGIVHWSIPHNLTGQVEVPVVVDDGQFLDTTLVEMNILPPGNRPSSFSLLEPGSERPAFTGSNLSWQPAVHPEGSPVLYRFHWATTSDFADEEWIGGLEDPFILLNEDEDAAPGAGKRGDRAEFGGVTPRGKQGSYFPETRLSNSPRVLDEVMTLPLEEGSRFYWKVRAVGEDGSGRWSNEVRSAFYEHPDPPSTFQLMQPEDGAELDHPSPHFTWQPASDPDSGDVVRYEVLVSIDGGASFDTLEAGTQPSLQLDQLVLLQTLLPHFTRHQEELESIPKTTHPVPGRGVVRSSKSENGEMGLSDGVQTVRRNALPSGVRIDNTPSAGKQAGMTSGTGRDEEISVNDYELPQDLTIHWKVDAIDLAELRTSSSEIRTLTVSLPEGPLPFNLVAPAIGADFRSFDPVLLSWRRSIDPDPDGEVSHTLMMASGSPQQPAPEWSIVASGLVDTSYQFEPVVGERQEWLWRVVAVSGEDSTWHIGEPGYFSYRPPWVPDLLSPEEGEGVNQEVAEFSWALQQGWRDDLQEMRVEFFDHPSLDQMVWSETTDDTLLSLDLSDWALGQFWWRVTYHERDNLEWRSQPGSFSLDAASVNDHSLELPTRYAIQSAYPNPFNPSVTVVVAIPKAGEAQLRIHDVLGREVMSRSLSLSSAGYFPCHFDLSGHAAGVYLIRLTAAGNVDVVQRVVLVK